MCKNTEHFTCFWLDGMIVISWNFISRFGHRPQLSEECSLVTKWTFSCFESIGIRNDGFSGVIVLFLVSSTDWGCPSCLVWMRSRLWYFEQIYLLILSNKCHFFLTQENHRMYSRIEKQIAKETTLKEKWRHKLTMCSQNFTVCLAAQTKISLTKELKRLQFSMPK